ncbi:alpha/beta hydrolase [Streptomyces sp. NBC_00576]|uniref:alpha/beta hydrolase n=1 Tax=Streptomyces sp. NBC_00576 TaxID=2903665 RepID=UPI002E80FE66|nr:alpha/beta hydrolase [Streptomyces sp. NBC_00576]WUB69327.1 alpha/beta hydrolase [Streptomyces sp. NBC_00576]
MDMPPSGSDRPDLDALRREWPGPAFLPPVAPAQEADGSLHYSGISYANHLGYRPLQLDLWVPQGHGPAAVVVWIHGGAWLFGDRRYLPETLEHQTVLNELLAHGLAIASVDYRLSGEARFPAQLHDVKSAIRYLRHFADELGLDPDRFGVWGESAGGHLAALTALTSGRADLEGDVGLPGSSEPVRAAVDWYGIADLTAMPFTRSSGFIGLLLGDRSEDALRLAGPVTHVSPEAPPFLLIHGRKDGLVPAEQSEILHSALCAVGAESELVLVDDADHIFLGHTDIPALVRQSAAFLAERLRPDS